LVIFHNGVKCTIEKTERSDFNIVRLTIPEQYKAS
jgi:hypothetical protein